MAAPYTVTAGPELEIVATDVLLLVQMPPATGLLSCPEVPTHITVVPVINPGSAKTVTIVVV